MLGVKELCAFQRERERELKRKSTYRLHESRYTPITLGDTSYAQKKRRRNKKKNITKQRKNSKNVMQKKHDAIRQPKQIICPGRAREKLEE